MGNPTNAGILRAFHTQLNALIKVAWPELTGPKHPIYRVTQVQRVPWVNYINEDRLSPPWAIKQVPRMEALPGWGVANVVYQPRISVYYVAENGVQKVFPYPEGTAPIDDIADFVEWRLEQLETALVAMKLSNSQSVTAFDRAFDFAYDTSEDNPGNLVFLGSSLPYYSGGFSFSARFGYTAQADGMTGRTHAPNSII